MNAARPSDLQQQTGNGVDSNPADRAEPCCCGRDWLIPMGLLAVLTLVFFGDLFFAGKTLGMRDTFCDFLPWRQFAAKEFHAGHLPLWNPYCGWGKPFAADPQTAVFYPLHLLFNILPAAWALKISWALHLWIAAASMFALARYWKLEIVPALIAAVSFAFGTLLIAYLEFFSEFTTAVWGPLVLLLACRLVDYCCLNAPARSGRQFFRGSSRRAAMLALVLALQYLAGHPEAFMQTLLMAGLLIVIRSLHWKSWAGFAKASALFFLAGLAVLALVLPQFLSTWELVHHSERATGFDPEIGSASVHPKQLLGLLVPFLFGRPGYMDCYWAESIFEFWAGTCYVGVLPLVLAGFASLYFRGSDNRAGAPKFLLLFCLATILFGLLMAFGQYTPVYKFLFDHAPIFNRLRWPSKYLLWVLYGLALLGGLGYQAIFDFGESLRASRKRRWIAGAAGLVLALSAGGYVLARNDPNVFHWLAGSNFNIAAANSQATLADCAWALAFLVLSLTVMLVRLNRPVGVRWPDVAAIMILFVNLLFISRQVQPVMGDSIYRDGPLFPPDQTTGLRANRVHSQYGNQMILYGCRDEGLFKWAHQAGVGDSWLPSGIYQTWQGGIKVARYQEFLACLSAADSGERIADLAGVHYLFKGEMMHRILWFNAPRNIVITERTNCLPRAYLVSHWTELRDPAQILSRLSSALFNPRREAVIEPGNDDARLPADAISPASSAGAGTVAGAEAVDSFTDNLNRVEIDTRVAQKSLLVLNDTWYPGWKASVDGRDRRIFRANYLFRGVFLEPGQHKIVFTYEPWQFRYGVWVSVLSGLVLIFLLVSPLTSLNQNQKPATHQA
jgi:hypothetical protein